MQTGEPGRTALGTATDRTDHQLQDSGRTFERQMLGEAMATTGFGRRGPAFFIWLGVTVYLTRTAIGAILRHIGSHVPDTQVVFDYGTTVAPTTPKERAIQRQQRLAAIANTGSAASHPTRSPQNLAISDSMSPSISDPRR